MTPRRLLERAAYYWRPDAFDRAAVRSIGGGKPAESVEIGAPSISA